MTPEAFFTGRYPGNTSQRCVKPSAGRFPPHLELYARAAIDDEVRDWLREAWIASR
ncbi:MAG: hypothetical protein WHX52_06635 [Anaerolineae bacterium]